MLSDTPPALEEVPSSAHQNDGEQIQSVDARAEIQEKNLPEETKEQSNLDQLD